MNRKRLLLLWVLGAGALPCFAAPQQVVDFELDADDVAWKSDGRQIALQNAHGIAIREARTLRLLRFLPLERDVEGEERSPRLRAWCGGDLVLEDVEGTDEKGRFIPTGAWLVSSRSGQRRAVWRDVGFSRDGRTLWFHRGARFRVLNLARRRWFNARLPLRAQTEPSEFSGVWPAEITFSPDGRFAADQLRDGRMRLWNARARKMTAILGDRVSSSAYAPVAAPVVWSPDGRHVATLGEDPSHVDFSFPEGPNDGTQNEHPPVVKIWDARTGKRVQWFNSSGSDTPRLLAWLDNNNLGVSGTYGFEVRRVGALKGVEVEAAQPMALSPDQTRLFAQNEVIKRGKNGQARVEVALFPAPPRLEDLAWSRDGRFVAASFNDHDCRRNDLGGVQIWNAGDFSLEHLGRSHSPMRIGWTIGNRVWSSDFYRISSWGESNGWAQNDWLAPFIGKPTFPGENEPRAHGLFLLPEGQRVVQLRDNLDNAVYERPAFSSPPVLLFKNAQSGGFSEVVSPDGKWMCFWDNSKDDSQTLILRVYELRAGGRSFELKHPSLRDKQGEARWDLSPRFSPDSRFLSWGGRLFAWPSGEVVGDTSELKDGFVMALGPGAQRLLRVGESVRVFDRAGRAIATLSRDTNDISDAGFSPDGKRVALARTRFIEIYDVGRAQLEATLYAWPRRTPTPGLDWLSLRPHGKTTGTQPARNLVHALD